MDKIWYRNPSKSEVIGRCGGDEKKRMTTQNRQKSNAKKNKKNKKNFPGGIYRILHELTFHINIYQTSSRICLLSYPLLSFDNYGKK